MTDLQQGFDEMDIEFIIGVNEFLKLSYSKKSFDILLNSSFLKRLKEDPEYVYHYEELYWAEYIRNEHENSFKTTV